MGFVVAVRWKEHAISVEASIVGQHERVLLLRLLQIAEAQGELCVW